MHAVMIDHVDGQRSADADGANGAIASGQVPCGHRAHPAIDPQLLRVDRWVGAVAAWNLAGCYRAVCAISIGTALTIDVVDHDGVHRGGLIAPSPTLMLQSL